MKCPQKNSSKISASYRFPSNLFKIHGGSGWTRLFCFRHRLPPWQWQLARPEISKDSVWPPFHLEHGGGQASSCSSWWPLASGHQCQVCRGVWVDPSSKRTFLTRPTFKSHGRNCLSPPFELHTKSTPPAKGEPPALQWEGQRMIAKRQKFTS